MRYRKLRHHNLHIPDQYQYLQFSDRWYLSDHQFHWQLLHKNNFDLHTVINHWNKTIQ